MGEILTKSQGVKSRLTGWVAGSLALLSVWLQLIRTLIVLGSSPMKKLLLSLLCPLALLAVEPAPKPAPKPILKINPGEVIVPTAAMRRLWGELVSVDLANRTGVFRKEGTDELMPFKVLPYAELLHHAAFGDLQDFRVGERAIFRMHEDAQGAWTWLTYIQDEMNMMNGHKEFFHVDAVDAATGKLTCTQGSADKSYVREKGIVIETEATTRYWRDGQPAAFADIKVGDKLRTQTHGVGKGKVRVCWEVFLDEASLAKFQATQRAVHAKRMAEDGAAGYVDKVTGMAVELTLFQESRDIGRQLRAGSMIRLAGAGQDRKATGELAAGKVKAVKFAGNLCKVTVELEQAAVALIPRQVARLWIK